MKAPTIPRPLTAAFAQQIMKRLTTPRYHQRGAVALMFGLSAVVLFGFMGLALDLSQTYDRKTELQNASDAAALAGARELNGTTAGINLAVSKAKAVALLNKFKYSTDVALVDAGITFSSSPDTPDASWVSVASAQSSPGGLLFIKVDTRGGQPNYGQVNTNFMQVLSPALSTTNTFGRAVAGRFSVGVSPIAVCALDPTRYRAHQHTGLPDELVEFGFRRGVGYNIIDLNPLGSAPNKFLLNPVDVPPAPGDSSACSPSHSSASFTAPFMCSGTASIISSMPGYVYVNTGFSSTLEKELNSRFNDYGGGSACSPATAPPDANIKEYPPTVANNWMNSATPPPLQTAAVLPDPPLLPPPYPRITVADLLYGPPTPIPTLPPYGPQPSPPPPLRPVPDANITAERYGELWAYNPAVQYAATPPGGGYTPYTTANWSSLYPTMSGAPPTPSSYPAAGPYSQTSGPFFSAPSPNGPGVRDRRVLNVLVVDCTTLSASGGSSCKTIQALGVGRFFMTVKADLPDGLYTEFAGLVPDDQLLTARVALYK